MGTPVDADVGFFYVKEERMFAGQSWLVERKARSCQVCDTEIAATFLVCPYCEQHPDGKPSFAGADAVEKITRVLKPVKMKFFDRGARSDAGCQREDYRRRS